MSVNDPSNVSPEALHHLGQRLAHLVGASRPPEWPSSASQMVRVIEDLADKCGKQLEDKRQKSSETRIVEREKLENLKAEFIRNVSHELRTPLASIEGFAAALLRGMEKKSPGGQEEMPEETRKRFLDIISQEARRLGELIENLLEMAEIESRPLNKNPRRFRAREIFLESVATFELRWGKGTAAPVKTIFHPEPDGPWIYANQDAVKEILRHLLDNAHNFSGGQEITLGAEPMDSADTRHSGRLTRIWVQDRGIGIPKSEQSRLFSKFHRVETAAHTIPGTGLGLAIVWTLVNQNGGSISVDSDIGKGAIFSVVMPGEGQEGGRMKDEG